MFLGFGLSASLKPNLLIFNVDNTGILTLRTIIADKANVATLVLSVAPECTDRDRY